MHLLSKKLSKISIKSKDISEMKNDTVLTIKYIIIINTIQLAKQEEYAPGKILGPLELLKDTT